MVNSMTAFSKIEVHYEWGLISWEIRSLNHRYLDIYLDFPKDLYELSIIIRNEIKNYIIRGKIECNLQLHMNKNKNQQFSIDKNLISSLIVFARWIKKQTNEGEIDPIRLLSYPGAILQKNNHNCCIHNDILITFKKALDQLKKNRNKEGLLLKEQIINRLDHMSNKIRKIQKYIPDAIQRKREKILKYIHDSYININSSRLEQELLIIIQKIDISEEIDRLIIHIKEMHNLLSQNNSIGKQLDFMTQELQRESNTITSKSIDTNITYLAISLKVLIEQIKEQIQNIE